jgi:hypothetical protein
MSEPLKIHTKLNRTYNLRKIYDYLEKVRKSGIINMYGASPLLYMGKDRIEHEFKYKHIGDEESYDEVLEMAEEIKNELISGAMERVGTDNIRSLERKIQIDARDILMTWSKLKGIVIRESKEDEYKPHHFLRRITKDKLDEIVYDNIKYMIDWSTGMEYEDICESYELCEYDKFTEAMMTIIIDDIEKMIEVPRDRQFYYGMKNTIKKLYKPQLQNAYDIINNSNNTTNSSTFGKYSREEQTESEITERCWKGYTQKGMKTMFGKRYPNCVKVKK